jgi:integrase-like protein
MRFPKAHIFSGRDSRLPKPQRESGKLKRLFVSAGVPDGHAHRFRDTFSVEPLLAGVPIERVSILLGHQSVRITEKYYAPWVRARQEQLEADVRRTWETPEPQRRVRGGYTKKRVRVIAFKSTKEWCRRGESGFRPPLIPRNLLILQDGRNYKNIEFT